MNHRACRVITAVALFSTASAAHAQSLIGDEFTWDFVQSGPFGPNPRTAIVGPGPEFNITFIDRVYEVDIDESSITVTATATGGLFTDTWGSNGTDLLAQLQITGLGFDDGDTINSASVSGTAGNLDADDIEFTGDSVFIGASLPNDNTVGWQDGQSITVDLAGCPGPNVVNLNNGDEFATIADAIAASSSGDTLELGPCTFFERGLVRAKSLTIRGAGAGLTVIDGAGVPGAVFNIFGATTDVTIEQLSIRNGLADTGNGGSAIRATDSRVTVRDCVLSGHDSGGRVASAMYSQDSQFVLERCVFTDNVSTRNGTAVPHAYLIGGSLEAVDCLFAGGTAIGPGPGIGILYQGNSDADPDVRFVNCTFAELENSLQHVRLNNNTASLAVVGCVFDSTATAIVAPGGADVVATANVFVGATGNNTDAEPIFVDATNGDYRLAAGSPGIDIADASAYLSASGGLFDLAGNARFNNDAAFPDAGSGPFLFLDAGAFEFQGNSPNPIDADFNNDGDVNNEDITDLVDLIEAAGG